MEGGGGEDSTRETREWTGTGSVSERNRTMSRRSKRTMINRRRSRRRTRAIRTSCSSPSPLFCSEVSGLKILMQSWFRSERQETDQLRCLAVFLRPGVGRGHVRSGGQGWCRVSQVSASCRASRALKPGPWNLDPDRWPSARPGPGDDPVLW